MKRIRAWITRHPVPSFNLGAFAISWGGALVAIGGPSRLLAGQPPAAVGAIVSMATALGPAVAGVAVTVAASGKAGLGGQTG